MKGPNGGRSRWLSLAGLVLVLGSGGVWASSKAPVTRKAASTAKKTTPAKKAAAKKRGGAKKAAKKRGGAKKKEPAGVEEVWYPRYPALSPEGKKIAFSYQGDLWVVGREGGVARRLTVHRAYDFSPRWSPDGRWIMFTSRRSGNNDVYVMGAQGGVPRRITYHSAKDRGVDWSPDGRWLLFESNRENSISFYRVAVQGGTPQRFLGGFWNKPNNGRFSPEGKRLLFTDGHESRSFWWRKGYRGPYNADILLWEGAKNRVRSLTRYKGNDLWPLWSPCGAHFYFVSDRSGVFNLWRGAIKGGNVTPLTRFRRHPVRWPSIDRRGTAIVYERGFRLWLTDLKSGRSRPLPIRAAADHHYLGRSWKKVKKISEMALSPDGKKLAFVLYGDVFVTDAKGKTTLRRLTRTPWLESHLTWDQDSLHLVYVSERGHGFALYRLSALGDQPEQILVQSKQELGFPLYSPDGKKLLYIRGKNDLMLWSKGEKPRRLLRAQLGGVLRSRAPRWSEDSQWILYRTLDRTRGNLWALRLGQKKPLRLTPTAADDVDGHFTPDGKYLLFSSNRYGGDWFTPVGHYDLYLLPLRRKPPVLAEDRLDKLFQKKRKVGPKEKKGKDSPKQKKGKDGKSASAPTSREKSSTASGKKKEPASAPATKKAKGKTKKAEKSNKAKKAKKVLQIDMADLERRTRVLLSAPGHERWPTPSPKGKKVVYFSSATGKWLLWQGVLKKKGLRQTKPLSRKLFFRGAWTPHGLTWGLKGKAVYVLHRGSIVRVGVPAGKVRRFSFKARLQVDRQAQLFQQFRQIWLTLYHYFYDPTFRGKDWKEIYRRYRPVVQKLQSYEDWRDLMNEMVGELNASHLGIYPSRRYRKSPYRTGALGADLRSDSQGRFRLKRILRHGPLYRADPQLKDGLYLLAIDGVSLSPQTNVHRLLADKVGRRVRLLLHSKPTTKGARTLTVRPVATWPERQLRYRAWVRQRKALVRRWSKNRIGYLHMRGMGRSNLRRFIRDFETDLVPRQAAIVDLRFNWGGNIHDRVLAILSRRQYASWQMRGMRSWPQPFFSVAHRPLAMLINEQSLSDAEMTANGFRALKLGQLVGVQTYKWLIFTTHVPLLGGGFFRLPFWGCYTLEGKDIERVGVRPDVVIRNTFDDRLHNRDPQLRTAVNLLLRQLAQQKKKKAQ